jgi:hypothetical protein
MAITLNGSTGIGSPGGDTSTSLSTGQLTVTGTGVLNIGSGQIYKDASGNVGIGTSSPSSYEKFTVASGGNVNIAAVSTATGSGANAGVRIKSADGGEYLFQTGNAVSGGMRIFDLTAGSERARIDSSGNFLIGKTSVDSTTLGAEFRATGVINCGVAQSTNTFSTFSAYSTTASAYRFYVGLGGTVYATSTTITAISDQRLKENIRDLDDGLSTILSLKPRKFDWKEGKGKDIKNDRGFIAQEFEQVFPDLIDTWKDEPPEGEEPYKAVRPDLIPVIVKAIQELTQRLEALEAK